MGMFDTVLVDRWLPVQKANKLVYQTKDLECNLDLIHIDVDGQLWVYPRNSEERIKSDLTITLEFHAWLESRKQMLYFEAVVIRGMVGRWDHDLRQLTGGGQVFTGNVIPGADVAHSLDDHNNYRNYLEKRRVSHAG